MWSKLTLSAVAILATALFAFLGDRMIAAYGAARYQAGVADGRMRQLPAILDSRDAGERTAIEARDRIIAADARAGRELARIIAQGRQSDKDFHAYQTSEDGRADCLGAERVRALAAARDALFPDVGSATGDDARPVPPDRPAGAGGRRPE